MGLTYSHFFGQGSKPKISSLVVLSWWTVGLLGWLTVANHAFWVAVPEDKADMLLWALAWQSHAVSSNFPVYVRADDQASQELLQNLGLPNSRADHWQLLEIRSQTLRALLQAKASLQLQAAPRHRPLADISLQDIGVPVLQNTAQKPTGRKGMGVLIGVIDTGLDLTHPAFNRLSGGSRVVAVWDQDAPDHSLSPAAFGYGLECTQSMIAAKRCPIRDDIGHGTHVTAIAAGIAPTWGVAYEADIAMVRSQHFTKLGDAVAYLSDLAEARHQPLVINISVGGHYGPHDGRTPLEMYLNNMAGPGRIIVAAAGNDGDEHIHLAHHLTNTPSRVALKDLPFHEPILTLLELWTAQDDELHVALELWVHEQLVHSETLSAQPSEYTHKEFMVHGNLYARFFWGVDKATDRGGPKPLVRHLLALDLVDTALLPPGGEWVLRMSGHGQVHAWLSQSDYHTRSAQFGTAHKVGWLSGDNSGSIVVPATAQAVIAVGSYNVTSSGSITVPVPMPNALGLELGADLGHLGGISTFSSQGPTSLPEHTGIKPNLCAPGSVVVSAKSHDIKENPAILDTYRMVMQGTSMAAPHVTGVVALMLEADPTLTPRRVQALLQTYARTDTDTHATPNSVWGYGKLDAVASVRAAESMAPGCMAASGQRVDMPWLGLLLLWFKRQILNRRSILKNSTRVTKSADKYQKYQQNQLF